MEDKNDLHILKQTFFNKINNFMKKEKNYKKRQLYIYYSKLHNNPLHLIFLPFYLDKFFTNLNYILEGSIKWNNIMNLYNKIKSKDSTFNPNILNEKKPIYDRNIFLYILYIVVVSLICILGYIIYIIPSYLFDIIIRLFDQNSQYLKVRAYGCLFIIIFLFVLYYAGFGILITLFISMCKLLFNMFLYLILFLEFSFKTIINIGKYCIELFNIINKAIFNIEPPDLTKGLSLMGDMSKASILYMNKCNKATALEKLFAKYNEPRQTTHKRSTISKIMKSDTLPDAIKDNKLLKCLTKDPPPPPPPPKLKCPSKIID